MKANFLVTIDLPLGASRHEARQYIRDALQSHKGGLSPESPFFDLDRRSISVQAIARRYSDAQAN